MKHKLYKVLRIIFLTLVIISLFFSLSKKIIHAQGSNNTYRTTMPLYVSPVLGSNQGKPADIDLSGMRNSLLNYLINDGFYSPSIKYITFEGKSESDSIIYVNAFSNSGVPNVSNYPTLNLNSFTSESDFTFNITTGVYPMYYNYETGACGMHSHSNSPFILNNYISLYYNGATPFYALIPNQFLPGYPLYIEDDITLGDNVIFTDYSNISGDSGGSSIGGSGSGSYIPNGDSGGDTSSGGSFEFDLELEFDDSSIINAIESSGDDIGGAIDDLGDKVDSSNSKLDSILGLLQSFKSSIESKLDSFKTSVDNGLGDIRQKLSDIKDKINQWFSYMTGSFNEQEFQSELDNMPFFQLVNQVEGNMTTNLAAFNTVTVTEPIFTFDFSGPLLGDNVIFTLDLTSYDDYRHLIVPLITMILTLTFVFSLFNDLPDLFHGHSGKDNVN